MEDKAHIWPVRIDNAQAAIWRGNGVWVGKTVAELARDLADAAPDQVTHISEDQTLTAGEVWTSSCRLAGGLQAAGLKAGDVVAFQMPNWAESVVIDIAACLLGLVVCPIVAIYRDREVELILADSKAKAVFIAESHRGFSYAEMLERLRPSLPDLQYVWTVRAAVPNPNDFSALVAQGPELTAFPDVSPDAVKLILYTSGTTGRPKAVLHSHETLARSLRRYTEHWAIAPGEAVLMPSPLTHVTGFGSGIELPFHCGTRTIIMERWNAQVAVELIRKHSVVFTMSATPFLQELIDAVEQSGELLPSLRLFACGGAAVPAELIYRAARVLPSCKCFRVYGSSEAPLITLGFVGDETAQAAETDGEPIDYEVKVADHLGNALPIGSEGEICARGPSLFLGYADSKQNSEAFDSQGFFRTGDLGYLRADGAIIITGRIKDLINRGGEKISAKEVEDLLHQQAEVFAAAVVAMPHARLGETVAAYIILQPERSLTPEIVIERLKQSGVAMQKLPEKIVFVDDFPQTAAGKVRKDLLRTDIANRLQEELA